VVSLIPSATELIYEVGAGKSLVGVTVNDTYPPQVQSLPKVGDQTIDAERLLSLRPDLVVLDTEFNVDEQKYRRLGLPVLALESRRLSDVSSNLRLLGARLGQTESGEAAAARFEQALSELPKLGLKEEVFVEIWGSPLMTVGADSLPHDLLMQLGLSNCYADQKGYFQVDPEDVVSRRPGIVILPSAKASDTSAAAKLLARAGVPVRVVVLDGDLFTNPSPRVLQGLKQLERELVSSSR
jgi:iron complex transport system substrate-binding protein